MFYDFIEIGPADFETLIQSADDNTKGLVIEPVQFFLDLLPSPLNCIKINAAISSSNGECMVYYVQPDVIAQYGFPEWARGCCSIDAPHPTIQYLIKERKLDANKMVTKSFVAKYTLLNCMKKHNVDGTFLLKIDTEGHDLVILNSFFKETTKQTLFPYKIIFEANDLTSVKAVDETIEMMEKLGYDLVHREHDVVMHLNIRNVKNRL